MSLNLADMSALLRATLSTPRQGLRQVLNVDPGLVLRLQALVLMAVASSLMLHFGFYLSPVPPGNPLFDALTASPFRTAILQAIILWTTAVLIHVLGRAAGGQGTFADALLAVVWLQVLFILLQGLQTLALVVMPPLAPVLGLASLGLFFWLMPHFVAEVHGFASVGKTFLGIVASMLAISFLMSFLLAMILGPEAFTNV